MIKAGKENIDKPYSIEVKTKNGKVVSENCADLAKTVIRVGVEAGKGKGDLKSIGTPKRGVFPIQIFTSPNDQFKDFKSSNKGKSY